MPVSDFMEEHFRHFNARELLAAAAAWANFVGSGDKIVVALAGALSTGEIGRSLGPLIRAGKVHAVSCTAANLEEDIFRLVGGKEYVDIPSYRDLSVEDEESLRNQGLSRITDTCLPAEVVAGVEAVLLAYWKEAAQAGRAHFPYEYFYRFLRELRGRDPDLSMGASWVAAAEEMQIPIFSPGFEDSTTGNMFAASVMTGQVGSHSVVRSGTEQFEHLVQWYVGESESSEMGFFQIGGGIAGDFAICAVPCIVQDLGQEDCKLWSYFAQISDSTTSYGSYSGAVPNEKITWFKLAKGCQKFMIDSDASIVAPLVFQYVLERGRA